jgi:hypothetical protein
MRQPPRLRAPDRPEQRRDKIDVLPLYELDQVLNDRARLLRVVRGVRRSRSTLEQFLVWLRLEHPTGRPHAAPRERNGVPAPPSCFGGLVEGQRDQTPRFADRFRVCETHREA